MSSDNNSNNKRNYRSISPAEWIGLFFIIIGATASIGITWGVYVGTVSAQSDNIESNTKSIAKSDTEFKESIRDVEKEMRDMKQDIMREVSGNGDQINKIYQILIKKK